jgi:hypothetical protein
LVVHLSLTSQNPFSAETEAKLHEQIRKAEINTITPAYIKLSAEGNAQQKLRKTAISNFICMSSQRLPAKNDKSQSGASNYLIGAYIASLVFGTKNSLSNFFTENLLNLCKLELKG